MALLQSQASLISASFFSLFSTAFLGVIDGVHLPPIPAGRPVGATTAVGATGTCGRQDAPRLGHGPRRTI